MKLIATIATACVLTSMSVQAANIEQLKNELQTPSANIPALVFKHCKACKDVEEVVKTAIVDTKANPKMVGLIVKAAIQSCPRATVKTVFAALSVAPEAYKEIKLAYLANAPKSSTGATPIWREVKSNTKNPMDFPTGSKNGKGPTVGGPGGHPLLPIGAGVVVEVPSPVTSVK